MTMKRSPIRHAWHRAARRYVARELAQIARTGELPKPPVVQQWPCEYCGQMTDDGWCGQCQAMTPPF